MDLTQEPEGVLCIGVTRKGSENNHYLTSWKLCYLTPRDENVLDQSLALKFDMRH